MFDWNQLRQRGLLAVNPTLTALSSEQWQAKQERKMGRRAAWQLSIFLACFNSLKGVPPNMIHMIKTVRRGMSAFSARGACSTLAVVLLISSAGGQSMRKEAQLAATQPTQVDVQPLAQGLKAGGEVPIRVLLRDGNGNQVSATQNTIVELTLRNPAGKDTKTLVTIPKGQREVELPVVIQSPGLTKLSVRQTNNELSNGSNWVMLSSGTAGKTTTKSPKNRVTDKATDKENKSPAQLPAKPTRWNQRSPVTPAYASFHPGSARLVPAAFADDSPAPARQQPSRGGDGAPSLMLLVSGENDANGVKADGKTFARIQVFYMGSAATKKPIQVWLSWSNGQVDNNPIVIKSGEGVGEAHWTSNSIVNHASVEIAAVYPANLRVTGGRKASVRFAEPILGIAFIDPPEKLTIVDAPVLSARFFDPDGNPIQTTVPRTFRFASNNPMLHLNPISDTVDVGRADFSTLLLPTSLGLSVIEASTPGLKPAMLTVQVTGLTVLVLCIVGGLLGGWLGYVKSDGKMILRIAAGVVVALVATWAYVYIGLPNINAAILHSQISTFFVSLLAALAGVKVLAGIAKALGLGF